MAIENELRRTPTPFTPRGKDNLSAWIVARNDEPHLGELVVYRFPRQRLVFGPNHCRSYADVLLVLPIVLGLLGSSLARLYLAVCL